MMKMFNRVQQIRNNKFFYQQVLEARTAETNENPQLELSGPKQPESDS